MRKLNFIIIILMLGNVLAYGEVIEVVTENLPPLQMKEGKMITGATTDVVRAVLEEVGIESSIQMYPWARAYMVALKNKNTLIYSLAKTPERINLFKWVGIIGELQAGIYKLKSRKDIQIHSINDMKKYVTGVANQDYTHHFLLSKGFQNKHIYIVTSMDQARQMLNAGRIDLIIDSPLFLTYAVNKSGLDISKYEKNFIIPEHKGDLYMAFSKKTPDPIVKKFRVALMKIKENGTYERLQKKWLRPNELRPETEQNN